MSTVFGKIIRGEIPCKKVFEDDNLIVIHDINPVAPVHLLIIPKMEVPDLQSLKEEQMFIMAEVVKRAQALAKEFHLGSYRLVINTGADAGQTVFHLHVHMIGGEKLSHNMAHEA